MEQRWLSLFVSFLIVEDLQKGVFGLGFSRGNTFKPSVFITFCRFLPFFVPFVPAAIAPDTLIQGRKYLLALPLGAKLYPFTYKKSLF